MNFPRYPIVPKVGRYLGEGLSGTNPTNQPIKIHVRGIKMELLKDR